MIDSSEPEFSCRSTFLSMMLTVTYFRRFFSVLILDHACLTLFISFVPTACCFVVSFTTLVTSFVLVETIC